MLDIGMNLKSDEMIEFLELHDLTVQYHFDRLYEGQDDSYTVECGELSVELEFDSAQRCAAIFLKDPESAAQRTLVSFPNLRTPDEVEEYALNNGLAIRRGPSWRRCDGPDRCVHYQFENEKLKMVTIMPSDTAPRVGEA